ncbi:hypothetical protein [Kitasatospora cathayae]|uniref:DUF3592 domain-containing protein n=1 Tax=Kitasatospora cathayae TaxID=3004092 RepID=A0ABY7Q1F7_9ACTN|nr:hypothetical protein [Kitasatospora sp. HUAS 3-15]WBP86506.1 hypothetical protein O1G21_12085 [Kitasatospora sp. HUAS 3-15]
MTVTRPEERAHVSRGLLRRALVLGAVSTGMIVGITAVDVYVSGILAVCLGFLYPVVMVGGLVMLEDSADHPRLAKDSVGLGVLAAILALVAYQAGIVAWHNLILGSGRNVNAVIVSEHVEKSSHGSTKWTYMLAPEGTDSIPGGPLEQDSHRFKPGDTIVVRVDPGGQVAPKLPGEADSTAALWSAVGLTVLIDLLVLWFVRPRRKPSSPPRPAGS